MPGLPRNWPRRIRSAVVQAVSLGNFALTTAHGWAANSWNARVRMKVESNRLRKEVSLLREEIRIKDARMGHIPAQCRPHYPPTERLAILELRGARGWSAAQAVRIFLVTPATITSWTMRLDERGPGALVRMLRPVNKFPDFVGYLVRRLKTLCPSMGKVKIAQVLARAGLHLGPTTVRRMLRDTPRQKPSPAARKTMRVVSARQPNHVWHVDLTTVPTALGFWTAWPPFARPLCWPFCWWLAVAVDHFSRRIMGFAVFHQQPSSRAIRAELKQLFRRLGCRPCYLISDHGRQFIGREFRRWCLRHGIRQRFDAVGLYGSLAVIERCIRTLKSECTRRLIAIPCRLGAFEQELSLHRAWYNGHRPHTWLHGRTPDEVDHGLRPACRAPRFEPRPRWPRRSRCAAPQTLIRGRPGVCLQLKVRFHAGRPHLPVVSLKRAA